MSLDFTKKVLEKTSGLAKKTTDVLGRQVTLMEVCGTHTTAISKSGLRSLLSPAIEFLSGPGCPVCVTDQADIDRMIAYSQVPRAVIATFGDMIRVPGTHSSLEQERARGAQVEICYSPREAVSFAAGNPGKEVIFLGVGFETTAPAVALSLIEAKSQSLRNYSVFSVHKLVPPAMRALLVDPDLKIDGFILPGHVSAITGREVFDFISSEYGVPAVITGFEALDIMEAIILLLRQVLGKRAETMNGYTRLVHEKGNALAKEALTDVFEHADATWRGFGLIPGSGLKIRRTYSRHDAGLRFPVEIKQSLLPEGCSCGEVLRGKLKPDACPLFVGACNPVNPIGPCMVSSEGACAAYFNYANE